MAGDTKHAQLMKALTAALSVAKAYEPLNDGERGECEFVVLTLGDALRHAGQLPDLSATYAKRERLIAAELELQHAQAGTTPDTLLKP